MTAKLDNIDMRHIYIVSVIKIADGDRTTCSVWATWQYWYEKHTYLFGHWNRRWGSYILFSLSNMTIGVWATDILFRSNKLWMVTVQMIQFTNYRMQSLFLRTIMDYIVCNERTTANAVHKKRTCTIVIYQLGHVNSIRYNMIMTEG